MPTGYPTATVSGRQVAQAAGQGRLVVAAPVTVDHQSRAYFAVESGGEATVTVPAPGQSYALQVEIIDIYSNSAGAPTAGVYLNSAAPENELDYSANGGHDIAFENPPLYVPSDSQLLIVWFGLSAGSQCSARVQYSVLQYVPVSYGG